MYLRCGVKGFLSVPCCKSEKGSAELRRRKMEGERSRHLGQAARQVVLLEKLQILTASFVLSVNVPATELGLGRYSVENGQAPALRALPRWVNK